jgi:hypothetical protein
MATEFTDDTFEKDVLGASSPALIDFYSDG